MVFFRLYIKVIFLVIDINSLGLGRGSNYTPLSLGEANWKQFSINGNNIRWFSVFPNVDLVVYYVNDVLKVEVIIKQKFIADLQKSVLNQEISADTYLTARFDILQLFLTSQVQVGDEKIDVYAENLDIQNQPLQFVRNSNVLHRLRSVETYILNEKGERMEYKNDIPAPENVIMIRSEELWQLKEGKSGIAEMSGWLEDILKAPQGDVAIDPSITFQGSSVIDTYLDAWTSTTNYSSNSLLCLGNYTSEKRILLGVDIGNVGFYDVSAAVLKFYASYVPSIGTNVRSSAYKVLQNWAISSVCWNHDGYNNVWSGGNYDTSSSGALTYLPINGTSQWVSFDVMDIYKSFFNTSLNDAKNKGFLIKLYDYPNPTQYWYFYSSDYTTDLTLRPKLELTCPTPERISITPLPQPYSDCFPMPVKFNGRWYININTAVNDIGAVSIVAMPSAIQEGLATTDLSNINNYLLRVPVPASTPTPGANGTPYVGFKAPYHQFSPIPTTNPPTTYPPKDEWYGRMAAICAAYVEKNTSPTPSPVKIHGFFHAEDNHDFDGQSYGAVPTWARNGKGMHVNYARIGYARSINGIDYTQVDGSASNTTEPGPVVRSYMSERQWKYPPNGTPCQCTPTPVTPGYPTPTPTYLEHGPGVGNPWVIERDGYLYLFYTRIDTYRYICNFHPFTADPSPTPEPTANYIKSNLSKCLKTRSDGGHPYWDNQTLCVARANINSLIAYDPNQSPTSPWYNFFDGAWTQPANGGWSSPIIPVQRQCASVANNKYLNSYLMLAGGYESGLPVLYLYTSLNSTFTQWSECMRINFIDNSNECPTYGFFVNNDSNYGVIGSVAECGRDGYLYYLPGTNTKITSRLKVKFTQ